MKEFVTIDGNQGIFEKFIETDSHDVFFSKTVDRRVSGSMNDLVFHWTFSMISSKQYRLKAATQPHQAQSLTSIINDL
jgi:hypothetical protein